MTDKNLLKAAKNAQAAIGGIYQWADRVEAAGGTGCISGIAEAHAMMKSLKGQRARLDRLVTEPLMQAIADAEEGDK